MRGAWQATIVDENGDVQPFASVEVRDQAGALVNLFDADEGGSAISNPFDADNEGFAQFYCDPQLVDIEATTASGVRTWDNVLIAGTAATRDHGTAADEVPLNSDLGSASLQPDDRYAHRANNLSDLANAGTSRDNLGLGTAAAADLTDDPSDNTSGRALRTDDAYASGSKNWHDGNLDMQFSGSAPLYACRAWVNFDGTGTISIRGSGNVSSITDSGVGSYVLNFTDEMPDINYSVVTMSMEPISTANKIAMFTGSNQANAQTDSVTIFTREIDFNNPSSWDSEDSSFVSFAVFR